MMMINHAGLLLLRLADIDAVTYHTDFGCESGECTAYGCGGSVGFSLCAEIADFQTPIWSRVCHIRAVLGEAVAHTALFRTCFISGCTCVIVRKYLHTIAYIVIFLRLVFGRFGIFKQPCHFLVLDYDMDTVGRDMLYDIRMLCFGLFSTACYAERSDK